MNAIAIILARSGSKGVPGKNVREVAGRPCIAWTIDHALRSRCVSRVVVSTDDARAAAVAREMGADVVDRPIDLATDSARVDDAARHAAHQTAPAGEPGSLWVILYANVPVRPADLIDRAVNLLERGGDSVQSYQPVGKHHPWWTARLSEDGQVRPWEGDVLNHGIFRRQDLPPAFIPDGGVIALTRAALMLDILGVAPGPHAFFGKDRRGVINPEGSVIDIDSEADFLVADAVLRGGAR
ncbi:N-acylneuraminate cytidylyltransferase [Phycisphaerales bacterium]|nr:N-acylneuraminate cytidylyltransferase [Phycisphaerales bacterium]